MGALGMPRHLPLIALVLSVFAVTATCLPRWGDQLEDVRGFSSNLEWWRPLTGHFVHAGGLHLVLNLVVFLPLAAIRERRVGAVRFLLECLTLAVIVAAGVRLLHSQWESYRGLSGIVYGMLTLVLLSPMARQPLRVGAGRCAITDNREIPDNPKSGAGSWVRRRRFGLVIASLLTVKSVLEYSGEGWLVGARALESSLGVRYLPGSHCAGIFAGLCLVVVWPGVVSFRSRFQMRVSRRSPAASEAPSKGTCARPPRSVT